VSTTDHPEVERSCICGLISQRGGAVPLVDILLVLVFILMLAGGIWGWRQGYAAFDLTTAVWLIVLVLVLLMIISPWPHRHAYW
jgi:hypothetical protein